MLTLGLAQVGCPADGDVVGMAAYYAEQARRQGIDLLVYPEAMMVPFETSPEELRGAAESLDGPYARAFADIARKNKLWIIYTLFERRLAGGQPYNTAVVLDDRGYQVAYYRKTHLFDTDFIRESERVSPGEKLFTPIETPWCRLGIGICYDLRFPELARAAALAGAMLLIYPSDWVAGRHKVEQWETLLAARAIENEMYVAGVSRIDAGHIGHSRIYDPRGVEIASGADSVELVSGTIDFTRVERVRKSMPVFSHRRVELYRI